MGVNVLRLYFFLSDDVYKEAGVFFWIVYYPWLIQEPTREEHLALPKLMGRRLALP